MFLCQSAPCFQQDSADVLCEDLPRCLTGLSDVAQMPVVQKPMPMSDNMSMQNQTDEPPVGAPILLPDSHLRQCAVEGMSAESSAATCANVSIRPSAAVSVVCAGILEEGAAVTVVCAGAVEEDTAEALSRRSLWAKSVQNQLMVPRVRLDIGNSSTDSTGVPEIALSGNSSTDSSGQIIAATSTATFKSMQSTATWEKIEAAKKHGRQRRFRFKVVCMIASMTVGIPGVIVFISDRGAAWTTGTWLITLAAHIVILSVLPSNRGLIRIVASFLCTITLIGTMFFTLRAVRALIPAWNDDATEGDFADVPTQLELGFISAGAAGFAGFTLWAFARLLHANCKLHARGVLDSIWSFLKRLDGGLLAMTCLTCFSSVAWMPDNDVETQRRIQLVVAAVVYILLMILISRPSSRARAQGWLSSQGAKVRGATVLAGLFAGCEVSDLREEAKKLLRCVPANRVTFQVMVTDSKTLAGNTQVDTSPYGLTDAGAFGQVDAFVSHSWHDDPQSKWEELQRWIDEFREREGREPKLWIDKYCINQTKLETNLRCLPIFLASCQKLVILWGPTFAERLWCVVEMFTFLQMGGTVKQLVVRPVGGMDKESIRNSVDGFTMSNIQAFSKKDLDRLLAIMEEAAGGDPGPLLREMLQNAINASDYSGESSTLCGMVQSIKFFTSTDSNMESHRSPKKTATSWAGVASDDTS